MLLVGSCFVENIGDKLDYFKFQNFVNPFGILFHPEAIRRYFEYVVSGYTFSGEDLVFDKERWHCPNAHSAFSSRDQDTVISGLNRALEEGRARLAAASHIVITLGTSWGYRYLKTGELVANCHKIPQKEFKKEIASVAEIKKSLTKTCEAIRHVNAKAAVIFTVSPVRHIKDGLIENQRSKAHLFAALHALRESFTDIEYFPSYEIIMDELRDYRFYDRDLLHPNALAIDYIWERFSEVYFSPDTKKIIREIEEIQKGLSHRPFDPESPAHVRFLRKLEEKKEDLNKIIPGISFDGF